MNDNRPIKDGDGCVYDGRLYIRRPNGVADVLDNSVNKGMWRRCNDLPAAVRAVLWPASQTVGQP